MTCVQRRAEAWLESDQWSPNSSWFRWHTEWRDAHASNTDQCLWLWYEDLVSNPDYWARKVAHFVTGAEPDDELVSKLVQGASFEKMKAHASRAEGASRLNSSDRLRVRMHQPNPSQKHTLRRNGFSDKGGRQRARNHYYLQ